MLLLPDLVSILQGLHLKELLQQMPKGQRERLLRFRGWIDEAVSQRNYFREGKWTESGAVGSAPFVSMTKDKLGIKGIGRNVFGGGGSYELRESASPYKGILAH